MWKVWLPRCEPLHPRWAVSTRVRNGLGAYRGTASANAGVSMLWTRCRVPLHHLGEVSALLAGSRSAGGPLPPMCWMEWHASLFAPPRFWSAPTARCGLEMIFPVAVNMCIQCWGQMHEITVCYRMSLRSQVRNRIGQVDRVPCHHCIGHKVETHIRPKCEVRHSVNSVSML